MKAVIIRAGLLTVLCVLATHAFAKAPCDDIAHAQQEQQCLNNQQQRSQFQAKPHAQGNARQEPRPNMARAQVLTAQQQDQLKAQHDAQRQSQFQAQQDRQRQQQQTQYQTQQLKTSQASSRPTPFEPQLRAEPLNQSGAKKRPRLESHAPDSVSTKPPKNSATRPASDGVPPTAAGGKSAKNDVVGELGRAIGQAIVQSLKPGNQGYGSPSRQNREPEPASYGGRRPKGERF